jgi:xanthine dehydrogenase/oxidase
MSLPSPALPESDSELTCTPTVEYGGLKELVKTTYTTSTLEFYLNGTNVQLHNPNPHWTLLDFIRSQHGLKGTKLGCGEGGCGACTVVLQVVDPQFGGKTRHLAVNACLYPLAGGK